MNLHYKNRYDKFIKSIQNLGKRDLLYSEKHHIHPRCLGGNNKSENIIKLTLREHYLAHLLLAKAYMTWNLISAFVQMDIKNPKVIFKEKFIPKSKIYEKCRNKFHTMIGKQNQDKVHVRDENGSILTLTKKEYAEQNNYKFHTSGMITCKNTETDKYEWVTKEEYHKRKELICENKITKFKIKDKLTLEVKEVSYNDYVENYKSIKVKIEGKLKPVLRYKVIQKYKEDSGKHNLGKLTVFDLVLGKKIQISTEEYYQDKERYLTSTKGNVLAYDTQEKKLCVVLKEEFDGLRYVGQTKGCATVFDKQEKCYRSISREEIKANKDRYQGPCQGKLNVVIKETGERKQILSSEYDINLHCHLGRANLLFKCKNILTNKQKNVNIYEWKFIGNQYEIIDTEKFDQIKHLVN